MATIGAVDSRAQWIAVLGAQRRGLRVCASLDEGHDRVNAALLASLVDGDRVVALVHRAGLGEEPALDYCVKNWQQPSTCAA